MEDDKIYLGRDPKDYLEHYEKEICFRHNRPNSPIPGEQGKGILVGIKQNEILLRVNNITTNWYALNKLDWTFWI